MTIPTRSKNPLRAPGYQDPRHGGCASDPLQTFVAELLRLGRAVVGRSDAVRWHSVRTIDRARALIRRGRGISGSSGTAGPSDDLEATARRPIPAVATQYARLQRALREDPRRWYCSGCLAAKLGLRPGVIMMLALRLESHRDFRRGYQDCEQCGQSRLVSAFIGIADSPNNDGDRLDTPAG